MIQLLVYRDKIKEIFSKNAFVILPVLRFFIAFASYLIVNNQIGYNEKISNVTIVIVLAAVSAFLPFAATVFVAGALSLIHIYSASMFLAVIFILIIAALYFLLIRFAPGYGLVVLAFPVFSFFNLEAFVPLVLGMVGTPISVFALIPAVATSSLFLIIKDAVKLSSGVAQLEDNLQNYIYVMKALMGNKAMFLMIVTSVCVLIVTYFCRKLVIAYAKEIGIIAGVLTYLIVFLVGSTVAGVGISVPGSILGALVCGVLAYAVQFFMYILDYTAVEHLQFDDEDYFYYVTAVPKLSVTSPNLNILKINEPEGKKEKESNGNN